MDTTITDITKIKPIDPIINAGDIQSTPTLDIKPVEPETNLLAGLATTAQATADTSTTKQTEEANTYTNLLNQLGMVSADTLAMQEEKGLPQVERELVDLQKVANKQQADYVAGLVQAEAKRNTRQETTVAQQNLNRQHAIDALLTNSLISAKQGDITFANTLIDRAIAAKYDPIKARIESQKFILDQVNTKAAQDRKVALDLRLRQIDQEIKSEENKEKIIIDAANQGAPADLIIKARKTKSAIEAASLLGKYSSDYLDRQYKQAQIANVYSEIAKRNAETIAANNLKNFITPPIINPQTGKYDPAANLTSVIEATGAKTNVKLNAIASVLAATQAMADKNPEGRFRGLAVLPRLTPGFLKSQEQVSNKADIEAINLNVQNWASGAALTDAQTKQVNKITPRKGDSDNEVQKKLNSLTNYMLTQAKGELSAQGINYEPGTVDYFGGGLDKLSNEELLGTLPSTGGITNNKSFFDQY